MIIKSEDYITARKLSEYGVISGLYFPVFGLNTEIYGVKLRIQSRYRKIRTRNNSVFGHISRSDKIAWKAFRTYPVDTGRKLNVLCTFSLRPVSTGYSS